MRVAGLILAGGQSERMGRPKQLLPWGNSTLLEVVLREVCGAHLLSDVVVVLNPVGAMVGVREGEKFGCATVVFPQETGSGCAASYRSGIQQARQRGAEAVVVVLGDQPGISAALVNRVVTTWQEVRGLLVGVRYRDGEGHPLLFSWEILPELEELRGDKAAWKVVDRLRSAATWVRVEEEMPEDIDTEADYLQAVLQIRSW